MLLEQKVIYVLLKNIRDIEYNNNL